MKQLQIVIAELQLIAALVANSKGDPRIKPLLTQARTDLAKAARSLGGQRTPDDGEG